MTGETAEIGIDESGSTARIAIGGAAYELEWQEDVILRPASNPGAIPGSVELAADPPCSCSVPDFVGYDGRPETFRCLVCGHHPDPTASIQVRRIANPKTVSKLTIASDRVAALWSKAVQNGSAPSAPDLQTFAALVIDEIRPRILDMVTHAREDGWKAALESKS